jgi:CBS domain-containing protein
MDAEPVLIDSHDTLGEVAERLVAHGSTAAAVVENGELVGIVTAADIVRASAARSQPDELPVRLWMTVEPVSVPTTYPASAAALLMSEYGIRHLPVADDQRVVGLLELEQVLAATGPGIDEHDERTDD